MEISAATVKAFRDKTGLPMMDCKRALVEANGDEEKALEIIRKSGAKTMAGRADRVTEAGRIALFTDPKKQVTAMVELLCESAPVSNTEEFIALVNGLAEQLATGPGAKTTEELLAQPFPGKPGVTLQFYWDDLVNNKIQEVFRLPRMVRVEGPCGGYVHHNFAIGVVLPIDGENVELGKDIAMHVASMKPLALSEADLDPVAIKKEREIILTEALEQNRLKSEEEMKQMADEKAKEFFVAQSSAGKEVDPAELEKECEKILAKIRGQNKPKPESVIEKIVDGKMKAFLAERTLLGQPFVKDSSKTVSQVCEENKIRIKEMIHWVLGR